MVCCVRECDGSFLAGRGAEVLKHFQHGLYGDNAVLLHVIFIIIAYKNGAVNPLESSGYHSVFKEGRELSDAFEALVVRPVMDHFWLSKCPVIVFSAPEQAG